MRKDVKVVVAVACLVLIGLLSYVLFAPSEKAVEVSQTDNVVPTGTSAASGSQDATESQPSIPTTPPVTVDLTPDPATQPSIPTTPSISVDIGSAASTTPITPPAYTTDTTLPPLPADTGVATANGTGTVSAGPTDWTATLSTGTVATASANGAATSTSAGGIPTNSLIGYSDSTARTNTAPAGNTTAGANTPAAPKTASASARTHKVAFGETLSSIAADYYGTKATYVKIAAANPSINPNRLKPGTTLVIPPLDNGSASTASATTGGAASGNTYTVKSGDSLQKISQRLYGSADKWLKIYELNRSTIGGDPHRLQAGMTIKLPETPSTTSAAR